MAAPICLWCRSRSSQFPAALLHSNDTSEPRPIRVLNRHRAFSSPRPSASDANAPRRSLGPTPGASSIRFGSGMTRAKTSEKLLEAEDRINQARDHVDRQVKRIAALKQRGRKRGLSTKHPGVAEAPLGNAVSKPRPPQAQIERAERQRHRKEQRYHPKRKKIG